MGDITNTTLTKVNNMITMIFQNAQNDTRFVICNKAHVNAFVWDMNDKGYNWVSTKVSLLFKN